jgi:membrane-anchored glycerophosphoryl diester phosphodiesterase (GDPDase)
VLRYICCACIIAVICLEVYFLQFLPVGRNSIKNPIKQIILPEFCNSEKEKGAQTQISPTVWNPDNRLHYGDPAA